jgi:hypothetical protein
MSISLRDTLGSRSCWQRRAVKSVVGGFDAIGNRAGQLVRPSRNGLHRNTNGLSRQAVCATEKLECFLFVHDDILNILKRKMQIYLKNKKRRT